MSGVMSVMSVMLMSVMLMSVMLMLMSNVRSNISSNLNKILLSKKRLKVAYTYAHGLKSFMVYIQQIVCAALV